MELSASLEDYLEAIYNIIQEKQAVRAKDIAEELKVSRPSVTSALHALADKKLIHYEPYETITLTSVGRNLAEGVVYRHGTLKRFFVDVLGIRSRDANESACRMEHEISDAVLERLVQFVEFIETCPRAGTTWVEGFGYFCRKPDLRPDCERCVSSCLAEVQAERKGE
ncbi:MAG: metal-dependent transcriptional regulator [Spirochaetales bacterium]|nr:metal-dependent transcriptional regulator [Spirochaetales bacterium]